MDLIDLIDLFRKGFEFENFCEQHSLDSESDAIEIFAKKPFGINSHLYFFEMEETNGMIEYEYEGQKLHNLFDFFYFLDVIDELSLPINKELSNEDLAKKLISYSMYES